jgi:hypothetical protein
MLERSRKRARSHTKLDFSASNKHTTKVVRHRKERRPVADDPEASPDDYEEQRLRRRLLSVVGSSTEAGLWLALKTKAAFAYPDALDANLNDPRTLPVHAWSKTIWDRHFMMEKVLNDAGLEHGHRILPSVVKINSWRYIQVDFGRFCATQKYVLGRGELPKEAAFRRALAKAGALRRQEDMFSPRSVVVSDGHQYNAVLIHGPVSRDPGRKGFRENGFIQLAFPYDDFKAWAAVFDLDELIRYCQDQGKGGGPTSPPSGSIGPTPTWKVPPKQQPPGGGSPKP